MLDDSQLLHRFVAENSQEAFATLVRRHVDMVYAAALREACGDSTAAHEVTQLVFIALARKARSLVHRPDLAGWLYLSVSFAAVSRRRAEHRWHQREREANMIPENAATSATHDEAWARIRPEIDRALRELPESDRDAILLRFFQGAPFSAIAERLRLNEDTARKRVERGLEKLRAVLLRHGITSTTAALGSVLGAKAMTPAPASLVSSLVASSLAASSVTGLSLAFMSTTKTALAISGVAVAGALVTWRMTSTPPPSPPAPVAKQLPAALPVPAPSPATKSTSASPSAAEDLATQQARWKAAVAATVAQKLPSSPVPAGLRPIAEIPHSDRSSPAAASDMVLWAVTHGDLDTLAKVVVLDAATLEQAKAFFASLPESTQQQYGSADKLALSLFAYIIPSVTAIGDVSIQTSPGGTVQTQAPVISVSTDTKSVGLIFAEGPDGWHVHPAILKQVIAQKGRLPGPNSPGK